MLNCLIGWLRMRVGWPSKPKEFTFRLEDFEITLDCSRGEIASYWEIWHEAGYQKISDFCADEDSCVVDVGANVGFYAIWQARRALLGSVLAFEPSPGVYSRLSRNLAVNGLRNASSIHAAVGDQVGIVQLVETASSINSKITDQMDSSGVDVECVTLSDIVERMQIGTIDILKIDTEGYERAVLAGARGILPRVRRIVVELHGDIQAEKREVEALLQPFDFRCVASNRELFYYVRSNTTDS